MDCIDLCMQEKIILACNCYDLRYPNLNGTQTQPCLTLTQYDCADGEVNTFDKSSCVTKHCPLECDSVKYELENSIGFHLSLPYTDYDYCPYCTTINVFYTNLEYTVIAETPQTTLVSLLSQFGGSLGIFISFSVFTLFEALEILILILYALWFKRTE
jgi:hypothetical protein